FPTTLGKVLHIATTSHYQLISWRSRPRSTYLLALRNFLNAKKGSVANMFLRNVRHNANVAG
ncbi:Hypothetical predicted protein, partial [Podarcis lilfordi]